MRNRAVRVSALVLCLAALTAPHAVAGTVEGPDLWVIASEHDRRAALEVRDVFPTMLADVERWLGIRTVGRVEIHLVEGVDAMRLVLGRGIGELHVGGCSPPSLMAIRLDLVRTQPGTTLHSILAHETVHHVLSQLPRPAPPRWFEEGLATLWAGGFPVRHRVWLEQGGVVAELPALDSFQLSEDEQRGKEDYLVYIVGLYAIEHFLARHGYGGLCALISRLETGQTFDEAFRAVAGASVEEFESAWRQSLDGRGRGASLVAPALLLLGLAVLGATAHLVRLARSAHRAQQGWNLTFEHPPVASPPPPS